MTETQNEIHVARNHKDRLFRMIFREKKELLSLYNAQVLSQYRDSQSDADLAGLLKHQLASDTF